jgi:hypothetical protein
MTMTMTMIMISNPRESERYYHRRMATHDYYAPKPQIPTQNISWVKPPLGLKANSLP